MKRKHWLIAGAAAAVVLAAAGITLAYLISAPNGTLNEIPIGHNEVEIEEEFLPPPEQTENTATVYQKTVSVKNTGDTPCYVRVFADFSSSSVRSISSFSYDGGISYYSAELQMADSYFIKEVSSGANPNTGWVYLPEGGSAALGGYYYYTRPLAVGESTPPLFTHVKTDYSLNPGQKTEQYDLIVYAESVQTVTRDGNADTTGADRYRAVWQEFLS